MIKDRDPAYRVFAHRTATLSALALVALTSLAAAALAGVVVKPSQPASISTNRYPRCGLGTFETAGGPPLVLLHGYGSSAEEWFPFVTTIHPPDQGRFVFPTGPEVTVPPDGPEGKRAWWRLQLDTYWVPGSKLPDMSRARPAGLGQAAGSIKGLLKELQEAQTRQGLDPGQVILGGFSQGAMVAADVAFNSATPLRALVLLSPTVVDERGWRRGLGRRRGLPVFIAHGHKDEVLPYAASDHLQQVLRRAGLAVTFFSFDGGHEIPAAVVDALNEFLAKLPRVPPPARTAEGGGSTRPRTQEKLAR
jgi:phospholipase/carboxylesterase